ncbi:hypothetical protein BU26DRAFT_499996 [Trematosphaeria pertusa]|uniref:Uncharacterized protein n=1 Tax=Trematosphaeria pertusa TaxID=390896 RepID=A0A6A6IUS1_9PLEO|nr:uncharacterized protein BU26DRAFT_499996 [Trematosphaeria pertusa]KAF2254194.1 hypothetical protein BU26DRAFT_499996 [Trematosphaeria pertusa]
MRSSPPPATPVSPFAPLSAAASSLQFCSPSCLQRPGEQQRHLVAQGAPRLLPNMVFLSPVRMFKREEAHERRRRAFGSKLGGANWRVTPEEIFKSVLRLRLASQDQDDVENIGIQRFQLLPKRRQLSSLPRRQSEQTKRCAATCIPDIETSISRKPKSTLKLLPRGTSCVALNKGRRSGTGVRHTHLLRLAVGAAMRTEFRVNLCG